MSPDAVLTSLGLPAPSAVEAMSGYDATVWRAEVDDRAVAVRVLRAGVPAEPEVRAMRAAATVIPVVPEVLATGVHDGREVIVMSWCPGRPIGELIVDGGDPHHLGVIFGRTHAQLNEAGVCHLDFQPFNVLSDGREVTGIVDWSNARRVDARLDIACTRVILEFAHALLPADVVAAFTAGWADGYRSVRPMPDDGQLAPFLAEAAARQRADWLERAEAGEIPAAVAEVADAIARRWV